MYITYNTCYIYIYVAVLVKFHAPIKIKRLFILLFMKPTRVDLKLYFLFCYFFRHPLYFEPNPSLLHFPPSSMYDDDDDRCVDDGNDVELLTGL